MDTLLTMREAARYLACSVSSIRNYTKHKGKYERANIGGTYSLVGSFVIY